MAHKPGWRSIFLRLSPAFVVNIGEVGIFSSQSYKPVMIRSWIADVVSQGIRHPQQYLLSPSKLTGMYSWRELKLY